MDAFTVTELIRTFSYSHGHLAFLQHGHITISDGLTRQVVRHPSLLVAPPKRKEMLEVQGQCRCISVEKTVWLGGLEYFSRKGMYLPTGLAFLWLSQDDSRYLSTLFIQAITEARGGGPFQDTWMDLHCKSILALGLRRWLSTLDQKPCWSISDTASWIDAHFREEFTLEFFAEKCAMNTSTFSREFKQLTGSPLFEYINRVRIRHACQALKRSDTSVVEVAFDLGYNNISFFNRYFKRVTGMTPTDFRNLT